MDRTSNDKKNAVKIAKDVLANLNLVTLTQGKYCQRRNDLAGMNELDNVQPRIDELSKGCRACVLGTCFLSYVRLFNDVKLKEFRNEPGNHSLNMAPDDPDDYDVSIDLGYNVIRQKLSAVFTQKQMDLLERAFERPDTNLGSGNDQDDWLLIQAYNFGKKFRTNRKRVEAIMNNIIENGGIFKPPVDDSVYV